MDHGFSIEWDCGTDSVRAIIVDLAEWTEIASSVMDFYSRLHPGVSQHRRAWIGRIATAVMVLIGLAWIPVIHGSRGRYDYLRGVQACLAPPIFVFFLGVFWKRLNDPGCLAAPVWRSERSPRNSERRVARVGTWSTWLLRADRDPDCLPIFP